MTQLYDKITLIGVGLIGSSLARAIKEKHLCQSLIGFDGDEKVMARLKALNLFDKLAKNLQDAVVDSDLIILATPIGSFKKIASLIGGNIKAGALLSDVGSCKENLFSDVLPYLDKGVDLIPAHPIAGTEHSGPDAGFADLFKDRYCILTPPDHVKPSVLQRYIKFWQEMGSITELMDAKHHDRVLAITSHLPHAIAYTLVHSAAELEAQMAHEQMDDVVKSSEVMRFSASGFRDFTRIANSNPIMWRDIFLQNKQPVLEMLGRFTEDLLQLQRHIRFGEADKMEDWFTKTKAIRQGIENLHQAGQFIPTEKDDKGS